MTRKERDRWRRSGGVGPVAPDDPGGRGPSSLRASCPSPLSESPVRVSGGEEFECGDAFACDGSQGTTKNDEEGLSRSAAAAAAAAKAIPFVCRRIGHLSSRAPVSHADKAAAAAAAAAALDQRSGGRYIKAGTS